MGTHVKFKDKKGVEKALYKPLALDLQRRGLGKITGEIKTRRELEREAYAKSIENKPRAEKVAKPAVNNKVDKQVNVRAKK